jgi:hypothetical protein
VDRSLVEAFVMGGRVVFTKVYNPGVLYVPDTNIALRVRPRAPQGGLTKIVQGWPKLRVLAQHFDCKSLLEP